MTAEATGFVKVVRTPAGEAPEEVRKAWVGLTLPCYPTAGYVDGKELGAVSGRARKRNRYCVTVPQKEALDILARHDPKAAKWWYEHGFPRRFVANFSFDIEEVEIVSGVTLQKIIEVPEEAMGDPSR